MHLLSLSFFFTNIVKHHIRIENYKACWLERMSDFSRLERLVVKKLKRRKKLKLIKFFIIQSSSFNYCICIIMFKELKHSKVKRLCKVFRIKKKFKQNNLVRNCKLMKNDGYIWPIFIFCMIDKILKLFKSYIIINIASVCIFNKDLAVLVVMNSPLIWNFNPWEKKYMRNYFTSWVDTHYLSNMVTVFKINHIIVE